MNILKMKQENLKKLASFPIGGDGLDFLDLKIPSGFHGDNGHDLPILVKSRYTVKLAFFPPLVLQLRPVQAHNRNRRQLCTNGRRDSSRLQRSEL